MGLIVHLSNPVKAADGMIGTLHFREPLYEDFIAIGGDPNEFLHDRDSAAKMLSAYAARLFIGPDVSVLNRISFKDGIGVATLILSLFVIALADSKRSAEPDNRVSKH